MIKHKGHKALVLGHDDIGVNTWLTPLMKHLKQKFTQISFVCPKKWHVAFTECGFIDQLLDTNAIRSGIVEIEKGTTIYTHIHRIFQWNEFLKSIEKQFKIVRGQADYWMNGGTDFIKVSHVGQTCRSFGVFDTKLEIGFKNIKVKTEKPYIAIVMGSDKDIIRRLFPETVHSLERAIKDLGYEVVILGTFFHVREKHLNIRKTSILKCLNLLKNAELVLGPDCGLIHCSVAMNKKIVLIETVEPYWWTIDQSYGNYVHYTKPYNQLTCLKNCTCRNLQMCVSELECRKNGNISCLKGIDINDIIRLVNLQLN